MEYSLEGQALHTSPYVIQIEKLTASLKYLSRTFLQMEEKKKNFSNEEMKEMFELVKEKVCKDCDKCPWCWGENFVHTYQMGYEILSVVENFGIELNVETKRKLQQRCIKAPRFLREMLEVFQDAKQTMVWKSLIVQNREGCAMELDNFAEVAVNAARETERCIIRDEKLEKKLLAGLKKKGMRVLSATILVTEAGRYEIQVTARCWKDTCITLKDTARELARIVGRHMMPESDEAGVIGAEYSTIRFVEAANYFTMQGIARIGKGCEKISGDSFSMISLPGAREMVILSDGMGSGARACRESTMVIELLEELLEAGFPENAALQMINTALVMGREDIHYSTVDMCMFDLYSGKCKLTKAGASSTFIRMGDAVEHLSSSSLPLGVLHSIEVDTTSRQLTDGDYVVMVTDGVLDVLPVGEQDILLETIIQGTAAKNPKEMAHYILQQVLTWTGEKPVDDMTVLVVGLWKEGR
ncbi:MAG: SpoIIE family protein phosphatase [Hespellia sp.]|nr:SpoIIE family protein phosphatase [Hespellia sp.]